MDEALGTTMNARHLDRDTILELLRSRKDLLSLYGVRRIALFGSFARGTATDDSDVDLLVDFAEPSYENFAGLADALEALLGRKVDLLTPEGLASIRVTSVADDIRRSLASPGPDR